MGVPLFEKKNINYFFLFALPLFLTLVCITRFILLHNKNVSNTLFLIFQYIYLYFFIIIMYSLCITLYNLIYTFNKYVDKGNKRTFWETLYMIIIIPLLIIIIIFTIGYVLLSSIMLGYFKISN